MPRQKKREKKIVIKRVETVEIPDVIITTSASNMAGGTAMIRNALESLSYFSEKQLKSLGLFTYFEDTAAIKERLDLMEEKYGKYYGNAERDKGLLLPKVVKEYYEVEGYSVKETDEKTDKEFKIDLLAEKNSEIRAIQVKKGTVSSQEIREICEKAQIYLKQNVSNQKVKIIEIFAQHFPINYLQIRDEFMKKQNEVTLNYRTFHQIITKVPKYRFLHV